jgi:hypothetical protein
MVSISRRIDKVNRGIMAGKGEGITRRRKGYRMNPTTSAIAKFSTDCVER